MAVSNSPGQRTSDVNSESILRPLRDGLGGSFRVTKFDTPALPIHAFAFAIGRFRQKTKNSTQHTVTVYARDSDIGMTQHALDRSVEILDHINTYLNYSLKSAHPKIGIVPAPNVGGYSTPGLIFLSEANLFYQDGKSPAELEEKVTFELAYQLAKLVKNKKKK
ncbi:leucyl-cystinyl aminopeptidase [Elysia marginata]|uniref:Leucyl-cystinyl aminopeptidase n=1 Tax=Elysia marginata TaxID=1093978 RepID=A0AAV4JTK5_9GAST|nr:leucyl-cystinyl aminopeptidase [Elysia marginata]